MIDSGHMLDVLFGKANALWRRETQHEAMLLMTALYKADAEAREQISSAILAGPPQQFLKEEGDEEKDGHIFEMLAILESEHLPLLPEAERKLATLREQHPEWKPAKFPGLSLWVESPGSDKGIPAYEINTLVPEDIPDQIIQFQEKIGKSRRDLCEGIGVRIGRDPQWGLRVMDVLQVNVQKLPADAINPILWGIRATVTDNSSEITADEIRTLIDKFLAMIEKMPTPSMWSSLPSLMQTLAGKFGLIVESWNELAVRLASIFEAFDYEREEEPRPIEWRHRAINHPYGDTTELYLTLAQQHVNTLSAAGKALGLEPHAESFFSHMLAHYNIGSRYGLCLLAPWLSWIEAVSPKFADSLYPDFEWVREEERSLVAWSGYLWSNTLSRRLVENFGSTYLTTAKHHSDLASQERRAFANHVSAVFWFYPDRPELLCEFANRVDSELRVMLLHGWKRHLANAEEANAVKFFENVVFPYWDWCARQDFFSGADGDKERFGFWELAPLSFASFPEACRRAMQRRPSKIDHVGLLVQDAVNDSTLRHPNELSELLIGLLDFDSSPHWYEADWRKIWHTLKSTGTKGLIDLENALARKGISFGDNQ